MSKRGENIRKRKDGRWEARVKLSYANGSAKIKSLYGKTYHEVKEKLLNLKKECESEEERRNQGKTFGEIAGEWLLLQSANHKGATLLKYQTILETHLMPVFQAYDIQTLDEHAIARFISNKMASGNLKNREPLSSSYVKLILIVLTSVLEYAAAMGYRGELKNHYIAKPAAVKQETEVLDLNSQLELERYIAQNTGCTETGIALAIYGGLRIGEICALRWEEVDFENKIIRIRHTVSRVKNEDCGAASKTKLVIDVPKTRASARDVPINSKLLAILKNWKSISNSEFAVSTTDVFVSPRTFEYRYHKILQNCGITDIHFHGLRHTFATRCVEVGVDIKTLSELLGHASVNITLNTYVHSSVEQKRTQIEKLARLGV